MINATMLSVIVLIGGFLGIFGVLAWGWDFALGIAYGVALFGLIGSVSPTVRKWLADNDDYIDDEGARQSAENLLWKKAK